MRFAPSRSPLYSPRAWPTVRRFGLALWVLGTVLTAAMLPLAPPVEATSAAAGWGLTAGVMAVAAGIIHRLATRPALSEDALLATSVFGIGAVALLAWLSASELYEGLLLLPTVYCAMIQSPRRALLVLALALGTSVLLVGPTESATPAEATVGRSLLWLGLVLLAMGWSDAVRRERRDLLRATASEHARALADPLTGLGNRRAFDDALHVELSRAERTQSPFVLMVMDLDDFKRINDVHGHLEGDRVLREAAEILGEHSRPPDAWFRWGGDEFSGLYPATTATDAESVRDRLLRELATRCTRPDGSPLQAQIGIAGWEPGTTADELVAAADAAVLAAKRERGLERYDSRRAEPPLNAA